MELPDFLIAYADPAIWQSAIKHRKTLIACKPCASPIDGWIP
jgi:hypothetical protein